ncbi:hypothetical protein Tco_1138649 [Tanacetum coccineum]
MLTANQWMSFAEIERMVSQQVANVIETIAIYETKTRMAHDSMDWVERQEYKEAKNASNKRNECPKLKNQKRGNQAGSSEARGRVCDLEGGEADQDPNNIADNVNA